jgi:plasmid maintenance system antidote protein VapI
MRKPTPLKLAIVMSGQRQKDIAEAVGIDEANMSRIVNGLHCSDDVKAAIAREIGRTPDDLWPEADQVAA